MPTLQGSEADVVAAACGGLAAMDREAREFVGDEGKYTIIYWGYIGIMEKKMGTTIVGLYRGLVILGIFQVQG